MQLPYLPSVETEVTIEKLDKVAKTLSERIKSFAKFFGIFVSWCIFNLIIAMFFSRTRSLSLDTYRMITEGLRSLATQDVFMFLTIVFDNKIECVISIAMICAIGVAFFVRVLNLDSVSVRDKKTSSRSNFTQSRLQNEAYVVSYKQQVAFLA